MDLTLVHNFKKLLHEQFDELLISQIEQYKDELQKLNENLEQVSCMIKEKESLISELQQQVDDNKFEESNFTNVSMIQNLNNQIKELSSKNSLLEKSLHLRREADKANRNSRSMSDSHEDSIENEANDGDGQEGGEVGEVVENEHNEEDVGEEEVVEVEHQQETVVVENEDEAHNEVDSNEKVEAGEDGPQKEVVSSGGEGEEEVEEVEVLEIEHEGKTYYVQNNEIFSKNKNGDMGKKVGFMEGKTVVITKKDKKGKKGKKDKKKN